MSNPFDYQTIEVESDSGRFHKVKQTVGEIDQIFPISQVLILLINTAIILVLSTKPFWEPYPNADAHAFRMISALIFFILLYSKRVPYSFCFRYAFIYLLVEIVSFIFLVFI